MGLIYIESQTITVNNDWVRKNVMQIGYEALQCDFEDLITEWCHDDFIIRVVEAGDILWVALYDGKPVGAGTFAYTGNTVREKIQAVLPKFQKRGIYTSVLKFMIEWAGPLGVENDEQQTLEMQRIWHNVGQEELIEI